MEKVKNNYEIFGDIAILHIKDSKGKDNNVIVDTNKIDELKQYNFRISDNGYIKAETSSKYIHRIIYGDIPKGYEIDHINRNKLDNRMCNLRICTHKENCFNRMLDNTQGITKLPRLKSKPYALRINGKHIGYYATLEEAIIIRNKLYKDVYGKYSPI